jgi:hypothetical protein
VLTGISSDCQKARMIARAAIARTTEILPNILGNLSMVLHITFKRNITFEQTPPESWDANGRALGEMTKARTAAPALSLRTA